MSDFTPKSAVNYLRCMGNSSMDGNIARSYFGIADTIEQLQQRLGELEGGNQALAAHVERINSFIDSWPLEDAESDPDFADSLFDLIGESPQTSLADVISKEIHKAIDTCVFEGGEIYADDLRIYANRIKDGE